MANPTLEAEIAALTSSVATLTSDVATLKGQVAGLQLTAAATVSIANGLDVAHVDLDRRVRIIEKARPRKW